MTNLKSEWNWGTGRGKVHIVPEGKAHSFATARCGLQRVSNWGSKNKDTLEFVRATDFGLCARCAHHVSDSIEVEA